MQYAKISLIAASASLMLVSLVSAASDPAYDKIAGFAHHVDAAKKFSVAYPSTWQKTVTVDDGKTTKVNFVANENGRTMLANVTVLPTTKTEAVQLKAMTAPYAAMKGVLKTEKVKFAGRTNVTHVILNGPNMAYGEMYFFNLNGKTYGLSFTAPVEPWAEEVHAFREMVQSFALTK